LTQNNPIRILIADDHAIFRDGLLRLELPRLRPRGSGRGRPERPDA